jgi:2-iminobutanoate/2-iminopropanoate deaminase
MMKKRVVNVPALEAGAPYNLCVCYGDMIYVAGLPPFDTEFSKKLRQARASGSPQPAFARTRLQAGRLPMNYIPTD